MLTSIALMILLGLIMSTIFLKLKLPSLIGLILTGIILGPHTLNLIDNTTLNISSEIRQIALVIILTRAGLALNLEDLKRVGRPALLMCFIPALFEIVAFILLGPKFLGLSLIDSALLGTVIAAVSPAIIVPRMLKLIDNNIGTKKSLPHMILAGASIDDIFVIVLFSSFLSVSKSGKSISPVSLIELPLSIILGIGIGIVFGILLVKFFKKVHLRDSIKILIILSISFLFITLENILKNYIQISGLVAIMSLSATILETYPILAKRLSVKYSKLWLGAEIFLFVLVGASVDVNYALNCGVIVIILLFIGLLFKMFGVYTCLIKTNFNKKEKLFSAISYIPKATVQAAIGSIPLSLGLPSGKIILTVSIISIIITAPLGAILIDTNYKKLLK